MNKEKYKYEKVVEYQSDSILDYFAFLVFWILLLFLYILFSPFYVIDKWQENFRKIHKEMRKVYYRRIK